MDAGQQRDLQLLLLSTFAQEAGEQVAELQAQLDSSRRSWDTCRRLAHTLKGSARAVGLNDAEAAADELEGLFRDLAQSAPTEEADPPRLRLLVDVLADWADEERARTFLLGENTPPPSPAAVLYETQAALRGMLASMLAAAGYQVREAATPEAAAQLAAHDAAVAVVCDPELARNLAIPVVLVANQAGAGVFLSRAQLTPGRFLACVETAVTKGAV